MIDKIIETIKKNKKQLINILLEQETLDVAKEEINLSIKALENNKYTSLKVETISSYLPMNLPLYSLVTNVIIPKLCSNQSYYRPSSEILKQSNNIHHLLKLDDYNIFLFEGTRDEFFEKIVYSSNVVIFVGKPENANSIKRKISKDTMFIYFGVGQNPVVIADNANIYNAARKIVKATMFNYGQDCAKPNIILCKEDKYSKLKKYLLKYIDKNMSKKSIIRNSNTLIDVAKLLSKERQYIEYGGNIDFKNKKMTPVVITKELISSMNNYDEYYAPIFRIMKYTDDSDLKKYFSEEKFKRENMNISLFGESKYVNNLINSIILKEQVVLEIDNGFGEFGGYGVDASSISYKGIEISKPILTNREIQYIYYNEIINDLKPEERKIDTVISKEFDKKTKELFKDNLKFAFIFNSSIDRIHEDVYDKNFLICTNNNDSKARSEFEKWYFQMLYTYGKVPNCYNPGIIVTENEIEYFLMTNEDLKIQLYNNNEIYKYILITQVMASKKEKILGDSIQIEKYEYKVQNSVSIFCKKIFDFLLENCLIQEEREYIKCLFASSGDLAYLSSKLKYENKIKPNIEEIVSDLDDGFLKIVLEKQLKI